MSNTSKESILIANLIKKYIPSRNQESLLKLAEKIDDNKWHKTSPGKFSLDADENNTGETAAQRAIYNSEYAETDRGKRINWIDIELPVVFGASPRRRSLDIIGKDNENNFYLVELKYGKNGNHPIYAFFEVLCYYLIIKNNAIALNNGNVWHTENHSAFSWESFSKANTVLAIAADEDYWTKYEDKSVYSLKNKKFKACLEEIKQSVHAIPNLQYFRFKKLKHPANHKNENGRYTPELDDNNWEEIIIS